MAFGVPVLTVAAVICAVYLVRLPLSIAGKLIRGATCLVILAVLFAANGFALKFNDDYRLEVSDGVLRYKFTEQYSGDIPIDEIESITVDYAMDSETSETRITVRVHEMNVFQKTMPDFVYKYVVKPKTKALQKALGAKFLDKTS
ncbi:hypothetical protein AGMMS49975_27220 [Clostridia bacterium]|nr:hypothetical protein AGMMS49975_27220 [Clostridia bacterium]